MKSMKVKKRMLALAAALLLLCVGCGFYIAFDGGTYTECLSEFAVNYEFDGDYGVKFTQADVVAADRLYYNGDRVVCIDFHSLQPGRTEAMILLKSEPADDPGTEYEEPDVTEPAAAAENGAAFPGEIFRIPLLVTGTGTIIRTDKLNFDGFVHVETAVLAGVVLVFAVALYTFAECFFKACFSYVMVACGGIALFTSFSVVLTVYRMQWMNTFRNFLFDLADSGYEFSVLTSPVVVGIAFAIAVSNIWLMRHEGRRPQNMLGIALAVLWIAGIGVVTLPPMLLELDMDGYLVVYRLCDSVAYVLSFLECMLLSTIAAAFLSTRYKAPYDKDYLIILGCCIRSDGTLTPILKGRADAAIRFERAQFAATGRHAKFVPSGGQGADEVISESEAMKRYLLAQGYPSAQIIKEDKSVNTDQNIRFSRDCIRRDAGTSGNVRAGFATTNYHIFRGYILSEKHGLDAQGIPAKTKWYFFPNAFLREFAGLLFEKKWFIAVSAFLLLLFYTVGVNFITYV